MYSNSRDFVTFSFTGRKQNNRQIRIAELIKRELAGIFLRDLPFDSGVEKCMIGITHVEIGKDLRSAYVYIALRMFDKSVVDKEYTKKVMVFLTKHAFYLSQLLSKRITMKYTPKLFFSCDEGIEKSERLFDLFKQENISKIDAKEL